MPSTVSTDLDVPRSILHTQGISYINYCMSLAPGLLVFEGFFRARYYRSKVPPSRAGAPGFFFRAMRTRDAMAEAE